MTSILLIAGQSGVSQRSINATAQRMISLYDQVRQLGHRMKYLYPSPCSPVSTSSLRIAAIVERERTDAVLRIPVRNDRDAYFVRWPKDVIQAYKDMTAIANSPVGRHLAKELELPNIRVSRWCEGGLVLRASDTLIVSEVMRKRFDLDRLKEHYRLIFIPSPGHIARTYRDYCDGVVGVTHIDLDCALISVSSQRLLLVSTNYYHAYKLQVQETVEALTAILFVVPPAEVSRRVLNLIFLPPTTVLLPDRCPHTKKFLIQWINEPNVITIKIDEYFRYHSGFGGLGCMSSVIDQWD